MGGFHVDERLLSKQIIVFDIGGVLLRWDPAHLSQVLLPDDTRDRLMPVMFDPGWEWSRFDRGTEPNEVIAREIATRAGVPEAEAHVLRFLLSFHEYLPPLPLSKCIAPLRAMGKKVYLLTNYPQPSFDLAYARFPFLREADGFVCSASERIAKPDAAIFRLIAERFGFDPADAIFIDDSAPNIAAAAARGFDVWHYQTPPCEE